jgi:signal transduction histidine kinase
VFRVKGSNSDGTWNNTPTTIGIIVIPPFWKTWWFNSIMLAAAGGLLLFLVRKRIARVKKESQQAQQRLKQEMEKQQLGKEFKLKADFTAMVVHDLRSPLAAVMGYSDMLEKHYEEMDVPKVAGIISTASKRMLDLINDMLDISKFEAGKMVMHTAENSLEDLAREVRDLMQPLLNKESIEIVCDFPGLLPLQMDGERISQVITNFITNAVKFSPADCKITLQASCISLTGRPFQEFAVTDEGPGIPEDRRSLLFEKYAQLHNDTPRNVKGTGLGLAASRIIVELHGGEIGYRPGEKGGSVFFFRLPQ